MLGEDENESEGEDENESESENKNEYVNENETENGNEEPSAMRIEQVVRRAEAYHNKNPELIKLAVLRRGVGESHWSADPDDGDGHKWQSRCRPAC